MEDRLIPLSLAKIMQSKAYTAFLLAPKEENETLDAFTIYTEAHVGKHIQLFLSGATKERPRTFDVMNKLIDCLNTRIIQVVITDVCDCIFYARLFLEQDGENNKHIIEMDARPSDCLSLAVENNVPMYCTHSLLDKLKQV